MRHPFRRKEKTNIVDSIEDNFDIDGKARPLVLKVNQVDKDSVNGNAIGQAISKINTDAVDGVDTVNAADQAVEGIFATANIVPSKPTMKEPTDIHAVDSFFPVVAANNNCQTWPTEVSQRLLLSYNIQLSLVINNHNVKILHYIYNADISSKS